MADMTGYLCGETLGSLLGNNSFYRAFQLVQETFCVKLCLGADDKLFLFIGDDDLFVVVFVRER